MKEVLWNNQSKIINIIHISDTHSKHNEIGMLPKCDILIHSGDESDNIDLIKNKSEFYDFVFWFKQQDARLKFLISGNHSMYICQNEKYCEKFLADNGIILLNKKTYFDEVTKLNFYGEPTIIKKRGYWSYEADIKKIYKHYNTIPNNTNILITHAPPKSILDFTYNKNKEFEMIGSKVLLNKINSIPSLKLHLFGHCHDNQKVQNYGVRIIDNNIYCVNSAVCKDGEGLPLIHKGHKIVMYLDNDRNGYQVLRVENL